jgi:ferredoxin
MPGMAAQTETSVVTEVFIISGCTVCGLCEDNCPEVFDIQPTTSVVRPAASRYYQTHVPQIIQAAAECPVDVIRVRGFNEPMK